MLLKQQNWEQWQGAGISSGNWGVCQEDFSPAGGLSAPTPHLSYKHTQITPPLLQCSLRSDCAEYLSIPGLLNSLSCLPAPESHSRTNWLSGACRSNGAGEVWAVVCDAHASSSHNAQGLGSKGNLASAHSMLPFLHPHLGVGWHLDRARAVISALMPPPETFRWMSSEVTETSVHHYRLRRLHEEGLGNQEIQVEAQKDRSRCTHTHRAGHRLADNSTETTGQPHLPQTMLENRLLWVDMQMGWLKMRLMPASLDIKCVCACMPLHRHACAGMVTRDWNGNTAAQSLAV